MKIYEYLILDEENKYQTVWDKAVHIDTFITSSIIYQLYSLGDFYVEIHYNPETNKIVGNLPFKQGEHLEKYLPNW